MIQMHEEWLTSSDLKFNNIYDDIIRQLRSTIGQAIVNYDKRGILHSSIFLDYRHNTVASTALELSKTRLELDFNSLKCRGILIKDYTNQLLSNQNTLLHERFWNDYVLSDYKCNGLQKFALEWENKIWDELGIILHQAERTITATALDTPLSVQSSHGPQQITYINNYGGQQNIATNSSTLNTTVNNNNVDIEQLTIKLAELLKSSSIPSELKYEVIDLAETVAEQSKAGQAKKGILKTFSDKINFVKDIIIKTDSTLHASQSLYYTANQLIELIKKSLN